MRHQVKTERKAKRPGQDVKPMGWGRERERQRQKDCQTERTAVRGTGRDTNWNREVGRKRHRRVTGE